MPDAEAPQRVRAGGRRPAPRGGLPGALGRRLRARPDPGPDAGRLRRGHRRDARAGDAEPSVRTVPVGDLVRRGPGPRSAGSGPSRSRSPRSAATAPTSTAAGPSRSSSARPSSTPRAATSRSTACSSTRSRARSSTTSAAWPTCDRQILRAIGDPAERFREDKLRLLRAVRFAARFGMTIEPATRDALRRDGRQVGGRPPSGSPRNCAGCSCTRTAPRPWTWRSRLGLLAAVLPPVVGDEGDLPGQAGPARGRPLGPHPARPAAPARRAELPPGLRRPAARRRQARRPRARSHTAGRASTTTSRSAARIADRLCRHAEALERRARAGHLAGRVPPVPRRGQEAARGEAQAASWPSPGSRSCWPCTAPTPWPRPATPQHVDYCEYYLREPAGRPDQPAAPADRPRPGPARAHAGRSRSRPSSTRSARPSSSGSFTASARPSNGSISTSRPASGPGMMAMPGRFALERASGRPTRQRRSLDSSLELGPWIEPG